jgi:hypothetical protein
VNDLGGTLMSRSRSAGADTGRVRARAMEKLIRSAGRIPRQRHLRDAPEERRLASFGAAPLSAQESAVKMRLVAPPRLVRPGFAT